MVTDGIVVIRECIHNLMDWGGGGGRNSVANHWIVQGALVSFRVHCWVLSVSDLRMDGH